MATNPVYQFLDDLGTQEFIRVVLEVAEENFDDQMTTVINTNSATDELMPTAKATLTLTRQLENLIQEISDTKLKGARLVLDYMRGREGLQTVFAETQAEALTHLNFVFVTGNISTVTVPRSDQLYLQHDNASDVTWNMYVHDAAKGWICVGESKYDLLNYWSKGETNSLIERFYTKYIQKITTDEIKTVIKNAYYTKILHRTA